MGMGYDVKEAAMTTQPIWRIETGAHPLEQFYMLRNRADIVAFLALHPGLVGLLEEAHAKIALYFPNSPLHLEVRYDPEESNLDALALTIISSGNYLDSLDKLYEEWWYNASYGDGYYMVIEARPALTIEQG